MLATVPVATECLGYQRLSLDQEAVLHFLTGHDVFLLYGGVDSLCVTLYCPALVLCMCPLRV